VQELRQAIRAAAPSAVEGIAYGMPVFTLEGRPLIYCAGWKQHTSLYPLTAAVRRALGDEIARYDTSKNTIRFEPAKRAPVALVKRIVKARLTELRERSRARQAKPTRVSAAARGAAPRAASDVDGYLAALPADKRHALQAMRRTIAAAVPGAEESFSYGLPAFRLGGRPLVCFGASANHCSLHPMSPAIVRAFADDLKGHDLSKGTIRFVPERSLPAAVVKRIVKARVSELSVRR
jgi:uncharacterized protein YdhG (YjbR/CyaY superfamily)